jgi:hypothetical protein
MSGQITMCLKEIAPPWRPGDPSYSEISVKENFPTLSGNLSRIQSPVSLVVVVFLNCIMWDPSPLSTGHSTAVTEIFVYLLSWTSEFLENAM